MALIHEKISTLNDLAAVRILETFAKSQLRTGYYQAALTPDLHEALAEEFKTTEALTRTPDEGDLARQALLVIVEDSPYVEAVNALVDAPTTTKFFVGPETVGLVVAALVALQTHVRFERDKDGRWSIKIEKKPTSDTLLKLLAQKLLAFIESR